MSDSLHLIGYYILARLMMPLAVVGSGIIGLVTILVVGLILKPRHTAALIADQTIGRLSRWQRKHFRRGR